MCVVIDIHMIIGNSMRIQRIGSRGVCESTSQRGSDGVLCEKCVSCVCVPIGNRATRNGAGDGGHSNRALPVLMSGFGG